MRIFNDQEALAILCRRYQIRLLSLFGSTLKGLNRPDSDVDLPLLGGRKVDLRTAADLSRCFRDEVVRTAEVQYTT